MVVCCRCTKGGFPHLLFAPVGESECFYKHKEAVTLVDKIIKT